MTDLPERWSDEPWPIDDPVPASSFRPVNRSDTHDQVPQVADLADEAWEYAVDHGVSLERALVEVQRQRMEPDDLTSYFRSMFVNIKPSQVVYHHSVTPTKIAGYVPVSAQLQDDWQRHWDRVGDVITSPSSAVEEMHDRIKADAILDEIKRNPFPSRTLDRWSFTKEAEG